MTALLTRLPSSSNVVASGTGHGQAALLLTPLKSMSDTFSPKAQSAMLAASGIVQHHLV